MERPPPAAAGMASSLMHHGALCGVRHVTRKLLILALCPLFVCSLARTESASSVNEPHSSTAPSTAPSSAGSLTAASDDVTANSLPEPVAADASSLKEVASIGQEARPQMSLADAQAEASKWVCGANSELYFFVANPTSGSRLGAKYATSLPMVQVRHGCAEIKVFSQTNAESIALGLEHIVKTIDTLKVLQAHEDGQKPVDMVPLEKRVRVITVGGDGAFSGVFKATADAGADMKWIAGGIIPSGTGNDLAHTYGWTRARFPTDSPLSPANVGKLLDVLRSSDLVPHDSWIVTVKADPDTGSFEAYLPKERTMGILGDDRHGGPKMKQFSINNYFGIGFEGLVGADFDRLRGKSRLWNRAMYGLAFLRHLDAKPVVCDTIDTLYTFNPKLVAILSNNEKYKQIPGLLPCLSLTFLNSRTILGGMELWGPSLRLGLRPPRDPRAFPKFKTFATRLLTSSMSSGDGQIEILSVASTLDYARAATIRTNAIQRLMQGRLLVRP